MQPGESFHLQGQHGQLGRFGKAHDAGYVFGSGSTATLMAAADQQRLEWGAPAHEHRAYSLGSVHLVGADGEQVAAEAADVKGDLARALHRIDVEESTCRAGDSSDFFNGLQDAGLIVGQHHADQAGFGPEGALNVRRIDEAAGLRRDVSRFDSEGGEALRGLQNRGMFDGGGDEVIAGMQHPEESRVVPLGAAGVEDHLRVVAIEELSHRFASTVESSAGLLAVEVNRGGVAKTLDPIGTHRLHDLGQQRGGGVGVHIDSGLRQRPKRHRQRASILEVNIVLKMGCRAGVRRFTGRFGLSMPVARSLPHSRSPADSLGNFY